jgi:hypothetical protein
MTASQRTRVDTRPRRTLVSFVLSIVTLVVASGLVFLAYHTIRTSREGRTAVTVAERQTAPATPVHLVVTMDRTGHPSSALVVSPGAGGGGTMLVVPVNARVEGKPGTTPLRLSDAFGRGGLTEFSASVGRFLGVDIASFAAANEAALTALLGPISPVSVTFDQPVLDTDANRSDRVLFPVGPATLDAATAAKTLLAQRDGESESDRLPRLEALWNAIAARSASLPAPQPQGDGSLGALMASVLHGPTVVYRLPAVATDPLLHTNGTDMLDVSAGDVQRAVAKYLPGTVSTTAPNGSLVAGSTTTTSILASSVKP